MGQQTEIAWCDSTFNPWIGCTKIGPGCQFCYAESEDKRRGWTEGGWGKGKPRKRTSKENWRKPVTWDMNAGHHMEGVKRQRVFCSSLADWLDDEVPIEWLADLLDLIRRTPSLDWLLLSKRPENWTDRLDAALGFCVQQKDHLQPVRGWIREWYLYGNAPNNVWLGTSVEDQTRADERIPVLLSIPAKIHFLSCEPLLGPMDLTKLYFTTRPDNKTGLYPFPGCPVDSRTKLVDLLDWVIVGGESGHKARPFDLAWARSLRDQCKAAGVAFFLKQLGADARGECDWPHHHECPPDYVDDDGTLCSVSKEPGSLCHHIDDKYWPCRMKLTDKKGGNIEEWPEDLRIRELPQEVAR